MRMFNQIINDMRKVLFILGILIFMGNIQTYAKKSKVIIEYYQTGHVDKSTTVRRSPIKTPIDVYYDNELHQIEILGGKNMNVQIYLYDDKGNTLAYSPGITMNQVLTMCLTVDTMHSRNFSKYISMNRSLLCEPRRICNTNAVLLWIRHHSLISSKGLISIMSKNSIVPSFWGYLINI